MATDNQKFCVLTDVIPRDWVQIIIVSTCNHCHLFTCVQLPDCVQIMKFNVFPLWMFNAFNFCGD